MYCFISSSFLNINGVKMDKDYWSAFYKNRSAVNFPSSFAEFCFDNYINTGSKILELGSGNGRDALYFSEKQNHVIAVDQSIEVSGIEKGKKVTSPQKSNLEIINDDFVKCDYMQYIGVNVVYSRFTLHAITLEEEQIVLAKTFQLLPSGGRFLVEARTTKDSLCGVGEHLGGNAYCTDHYRRFINTQDFIKLIMTIGFEIEYFIESVGLSVFKDEDPMLMRIILVKP